MAKATVPKRPTRDGFELEELGNQLLKQWRMETNELLLSGGRVRRDVDG